MTPGSASRYGRIWASFLAYAQAHGASDTSAITGSLCAAFVGAPLPGHAQPSAATSRFRLTVLRAAFTHLRASGVVGGDPTRSLAVQMQLSTFHPIPLLPAEVQRLQVAARMRPCDTLRPATVELALAGLTHGEIARSVVADLDSASSSVQIQETSAIRLVKLEQPTLQVLIRRVDAQRRAMRRRSQPWEPGVVPIALTRPLDTYPLESVAPSISTNLSRALTAAGVHRPGVRPRSMREFAANRVYALTGRIEDVASHLGIPSLDSALGLIDNDWQQRFGDEVRRDHH